MSLDNILDETLDDLADLPSNSPFVPGFHKASMVLDAPKPKPGKKQIVVATFTYKEAVELTDPSAEPNKAGDTAKYFINLYKKDGSANDFGQGQLKQLLAPLAAAGITGNSRELIAASSIGVDVVMATGIRNYEGTDSMTISKIELDA